MGRFAGAFALLAVLVGCNGTRENAYTLYRSSPEFPDMRIHVATFDSTEGGSYNMENCFIASTLFSGQQGVSVRYWCELGKFAP